MKIHEYQAKELLASYGVAVPPGRVVLAADEVEQAVAALLESAGEPSPALVVKAQIHAGGRGKAGGVKVVQERAEAERLAREMFGMRLITPQTGPEGRVVKRVFVERAVSIAQELYLAVVLDRETAGVVIIASAEGGTEIEELAASAPEKIVKQPVDPLFGLGSFEARQVAFALGLTGRTAIAAAGLIERLYRVFIACDASMVEVNPLVVTHAGEVLALDAKVLLDDNGLYRHPELAALRDEGEEDPAEREAERHNLSYIKLDGDIGCMVNGAGLAMATMDILEACGGRPANFLDVGGGATKERVALSFKLLLGDSVSAIFVNIFGGIVRCDTIAEGIVGALSEVSLDVPLVVRLEGTNRALGERILADSGLQVIAAADMRDGAEKVVRAARETRQD